MKQGPNPPAPNEARPLDLELALRASSSRLTLSQLARQGRHTVSLLSKERMGELINRAVRDLIEQHRAEARKRRHAVDEPPPRSAVDSLRELVREVDGINRAKADLEQSRDSLNAELAELRRDLELEKRRALEEREDALDRSPYQAAPDVDRQLVAIVARVCEGRLPAPDGPRPPGLLKEWGRVEALLRRCVLSVAREERGRLRGAPAKPFHLMERRLEKLYAELDALENALKLITSSKVHGNALIQNTLRELGLLNEDRNFEKKREMLKVVFDSNREIRKTSRELEAQGITLSRPRPEAPK